MNNKKENRIWFLQLLRGIACLMVMYSHIFQTFWSNYKTVRVFWQGEAMPITLYKLPVYNIILSLSNLHIDFGVLGVGLFFLISGFVIPVSLEKVKGISFIIQRFTRIYPTYIVGLLILCCFISGYCFLTHQVWHYQFTNILSNASLMLNEWLNIESIDGINWTLQIELKFYLLMALLAYFSTIRKARVLIITACIFTGMHFLTLLPMRSFWIRPAFVVNLNVFFLIFMFVGTGFYNFYKKIFSKKKFAIYTIAMLLLCYLCTLKNPIFQLTDKTHYFNYSYALIIFSTFYIARNHLKFTKIMNFFANISYKLSKGLEHHKKHNLVLIFVLLKKICFSGYTLKYKEYCFLQKNQYFFARCLI